MGKTRTKTEYEKVCEYKSRKLIYIRLIFTCRKNLADSNTSIVDVFFYFFINRRFNEQREWQLFTNFFFCKWRQNRRFLAFHAVKCISEHLKNRCTLSEHFALFEGILSQP